MVNTSLFLSFFRLFFLNVAGRGFVSITGEEGLKGQVSKKSVLVVFIYTCSKSEPLLPFTSRL
jgi:hypothetical protein